MRTDPQPYGLEAPDLPDQGPVFVVDEIGEGSIFLQVTQGLDEVDLYQAAYLGHQNLSGTQRYIHLTAELFPEIMARVEAAFGEVIPRRIEP